MYLDDIETKEKLNLKGLSKKRFTELLCNFCRRDGGSCIQCDYKECTESFHIRCAKNKNIIKRWDLMHRYEVNQ